MEHSTEEKTTRAHELWEQAGKPDGREEALSRTGITERE